MGGGQVSYRFLLTNSGPSMGGIRLDLAGDLFNPQIAVGGDAHFTCTTSQSFGLLGECVSQVVGPIDWASFTVSGRAPLQPQDLHIQGYLNVGGPSPVATVITTVTQPIAKRPSGLNPAGLRAIENLAHPGTPLMEADVARPRAAHAGDDITVVAKAKNEGDGTANTAHLQVSLTGTSLVSIEYGDATCTSRQNLPDGDLTVGYITIDCGVGPIAAGAEWDVTLVLHIPADAQLGSYVSTTVRVDPEQTTASVDGRTDILAP